MIKVRLMVSGLGAGELMFTVKGIVSVEFREVEEESVHGHAGVASVSVMVRSLASPLVGEGEIVLCPGKSMQLLLVVRSRVEFT